MWLNYPSGPPTPKIFYEQVLGLQWSEYQEYNIFHLLADLYHHFYICNYPHCGTLLFQGGNKIQEKEAN